jgi:hypothetical protein
MRHSPAVAENAVLRQTKAVDTLISRNLFISSSSIEVVRVSNSKRGCGIVVEWVRCVKKPKMAFSSSQL